MKSTRAALVALTFLNFLNYLDRQAVFSLYPSIKADLHLTDAQLGMLGTACLLIMAIGSLPFGRLADRYGARGVVAGGVIGWCVGAVAAARAASYSVLWAARAMVGLGEAAYEPAANAFICNELAPSAKAQALAIFNVGTVLGLAMGVVGTGLFAKYFGWRHTLLLFGLAGIPFILIALRLPSRPRQRALATTERGSLRSLLRVPALRWALAGGILATFASGAMFAWTITFATRYHGYTVAEAGVRIGAVTIGFGLVGVLLGGVVSDRMDRWRPGGEGRALSCGVPILVSGIPSAIAILSHGKLGFFTGAAFTMFLGGFFNGPCAALIDEVAPAGQAAAAQGLYLFTIHFFGDAPAPTVIGKIADVSHSLRLGLVLPTFLLVAAGACLLIASRVVRTGEATSALPLTEAGANE